MRVKRSRQFRIQDLLHDFIFRAFDVTSGKDSKFEQSTRNDIVHLELDGFPIGTRSHHGESGFLHRQHKLVDRFALGRESSAIANLRGQV